MAASSCALLLRASLVSMQGASGLAKDTYKFVAVSLTLASICTALAQVMQVRSPRDSWHGDLSIIFMKCSLEWKNMQVCCDC